MHATARRLLHCCIVLTAVGCSALRTVATLSPTPTGIGNRHTWRVESSTDGVHWTAGPHGVSRRVASP